jgi:hypothetical protein
MSKTILYTTARPHLRKSTTGSPPSLGAHGHRPTYGTRFRWITSSSLVADVKIQRITGHTVFCAADY